MLIFLIKNPNNENFWCCIKYLFENKQLKTLIIYSKFLILQTIDNFDDQN